MENKWEWEFLQVKGSAHTDNKNIVEVPTGFMPIGAESHWGTSYAGHMTFHFVRPYQKPDGRKRKNK